MSDEATKPPERDPLFKVTQVVEVLVRAHDGAEQAKALAGQSTWHWLDWRLADNLATARVTATQHAEPHDGARL